MKKLRTAAARQIAVMGRAPGRLPTRCHHLWDFGALPLIPRGRFAPNLRSRPVLANGERRSAVPRDA